MALITRIHKAITQREILGKGHAAGEGEQQRLSFSRVFLGPQSRDHAENAVPQHHLSTHELLRRELCSPALRTDISLGDKSSPFSQTFRLDAVSLVQTKTVLTKMAFVCEKRQTITCATVTPSFCFPEL